MTSSIAIVVVGERKAWPLNSAELFAHTSIAGHELDSFLFAGLGEREIMLVLRGFLVLRWKVHAFATPEVWPSLTCLLVLKGKVHAFATPEVWPSLTCLMVVVPMRKIESGVKRGLAIIFIVVLVIIV